MIDKFRGISMLIFVTIMAVMVGYTFHMLIVELRMRPDGRWGDVCTRNYGCEDFQRKIDISRVYERCAEEYEEVGVRFDPDGDGLLCEDTLFE